MIRPRARGLAIAACAVAASAAGCGSRSAPPPAAPAATTPARDALDPLLFDRLTDELAVRYEQELRDHAGFVTFGGGITVTGEIVYVTPDGDPTDPKADLTRVLTELSADRYAVGVVIVDTMVSPPDGSPRTDAVWTIAEARAGFVMQTFQPYSVAAGVVTFGTGFEVPGASPMIFVARPR